MRKIALLLLAFILFTSCGTVFGGSNYYAKVIVNNSPTARIIYDGKEMGKGEALIKVKRSKANQFSFTVNEEGKKDQFFEFKKRKFRGWSFAGSLLLGPSIYYVIPLGVILDFATSSLWKPSTEEKGVSKQNYKYYVYNVYYSEKQAETSSKQTFFTDIIHLKNGSTIKGIIVKQVPNEYVKIQTLDNNISTYQISEIEKMTIEELK